MSAENVKIFNFYCVFCLSFCKLITLSTIFKVHYHHLLCMYVYVCGPQSGIKKKHERNDLRGAWLFTQY